MRVLIDTNIILDVILNRAEHSRLARLLVRKHEAKLFQGFVSASAITDIYFLVEKERKHEFALLAIKKIVRMLTVIPVDLEIIKAALMLPMNDFEDAVQTVAAKRYGIETVVTRDKMGYDNSGLKVYLPGEFLEGVK